MLIVEKITNYNYSRFKGTFNSLPKKRQDELKRSNDAHEDSKRMLLDYISRNNLTYNLISDDMVTASIVDKNHIIISLGGDGTFLKTSQYVLNQYILGINSDPENSRGFLASCNKDSFHKSLDSLFNKSPELEYVFRLGASVNGVELRNRALNEIIVGNPHIGKTSRFNISYNSHKGSVVGNGILVSTAKGSHAFYKNAGGKPFSKASLGLVNLLSLEEKGTISFPSVIDYVDFITLVPKQCNYKILFDSGSTGEVSIHQGDEVKIYLDKKNPLKVLK